MMNIDREWLRLNVENVCRFCLSVENCLPLFIEATLNECLLDAVDVLVPKVDENDGLPNCVCSECHRKMADFMQFEATALEAYTILANVLTTDQDDVADEHDDDDEQDAKSMLHDPEPVTRSGDERAAKDTESDTIIELETVPNDNHQSVHTGADKGPKSTTTLQKKPCPVCGKLVSQLSKHVQVHSTGKNFSCTHCDKRFAHRSSLQKHLNIHRNIRNYRCEYCEQCFCDRSSLRYHLAKHRGVQRFRCEPCDRLFYTSTQYKQHQNLAHRERSFRCEMCGQMFLLKHHLLEHRQLHTDERSFECDVCGKRFKRERYLIVHKRQHVNKHEKPDGLE